VNSAPVDFDVAVIGGGIVGSTVVCALAAQGFAVALVDPGRVPKVAASDPPDLRVSAMTLASRSIFESLQVWADIEALRLAPYHEMVVWDSEGRGEIHFLGADVGAACLGWIVENRVIQWVLARKAECLESAEMFVVRSLTKVTPDDDGVAVQLDDGTRFRARLVVGADGARSQVRRQANIETTGWSYQQSAVVATVATEEPHADTAWQRFLPTGPLAFLPLFDGSSSIVWSTDTEAAQRLCEASRAEFEVALEDAFAGRLGGIELRSERAVFPLQLQHANHYVKPRIVLVGDAAHTVHPLAGQGVNIGLLDAAALCEVLAEARASERDLGSVRVLRRYERWRKGQNLMMLGVMDGFKRLFGARSMVLRLGRNFGLSATDRAWPIKNALARRAMGLGGDLPKMARRRLGDVNGRSALTG
jgi:2-octaprenylphenol hydroxylase